jgi:hypothetical protein
MSGMEFGDADLLPGAALAGKTEWEDALIKHGIQEAQLVQKTDDDLYQEHVERKQGEVSTHASGLARSHQSRHGSLSSSS